MGAARAGLARARNRGLSNEDAYDGRLFRARARARARLRGNPAIQGHSPKPPLRLTSPFTEPRLAFHLRTGQMKPASSLSLPVTASKNPKSASAKAPKRVKKSPAGDVRA